MFCYYIRSIIRDFSTKVISARCPFRFLALVNTLFLDQ